MADEGVDGVRARVEELLPTLRERAQEAEELRRIPDDSIKSLQETGFFKLIQPSRWGGYECDPVIFYEPKRRYWDRAELGPVAEGLLGDGDPAEVELV